MIQPHDYCKNFPVLSDDALTVKANDIKANKLTPEIVTHEDRILDDYNLYRACMKADVEPRLVPFAGESPIEFAIRQNIADQVFTKDQLTVFAFDVTPRLEEEAKERQRLGKANSPDPGQSRDKAAALFGVNGRAVGTVKNLAKTLPEILPLVRAGKLKIGQSQKIAKALKGRTVKERKDLLDAGAEALLKIIERVEPAAPDVLTGDLSLLESQPDESVSLFLATGYAGLAEVAARKLSPDGAVLCPWLPRELSAAVTALGSLESWGQFYERRGGHCQPWLAYAKAVKEVPAWSTDWVKKEELLRRLVQLVQPAKPKWIYKIGTKQIAEQVCNIADGCSHKCPMCYRQKLCDWRGEPEEGRDKPVFRNLDQADDHWDTTVMFSSNHDTEPALLEESVVAMRKVLEQGNHLFWVTKPHMVCVERICKEFKPSDKFTFMPTIMTLDEKLQKFWAPGAPGCEETLACLKHGHATGHHTSAIIEPMLDAENIVQLYETISPYITDEILVGPMNHLADVRKRNVGLPGIGEALAEIEKWQTDEALWKVHGWLSGLPKVRFKDDMRKALGLPPNDCD